MFIDDTKGGRKYQLETNTYNETTSSLSSKYVNTVDKAVKIIFSFILNPTVKLENETQIYLLSSFHAVF
jgi:hypothetical protein